MSACCFTRSANEPASAIRENLNLRPCIVHVRSAPQALASTWVEPTKQTPLVSAFLQHHACIQLQDFNKDLSRKGTKTESYLSEMPVGCQDIADPELHHDGH